MIEKRRDFADNYSDRACPFDLERQCMGPTCWAFEVQVTDAAEGQGFDTPEERDEFIKENEEFTRLTEHTANDYIWVQVKKQDRTWWEWISTPSYMYGTNSVKRKNPEAGKKTYTAWKDVIYARCKRLES